MYLESRERVFVTSAERGMDRRAMKDEEITSEHTHARARGLLEEIENLRQEMGRARDMRVPMHVVDASPREVFYHALTVHRKADQLCVELGVPSVSPPKEKEVGRARPADVLRVLNSTGERLVQARAHLRLDGDVVQPQRPGEVLERDPGKVASEVLSNCLVASRQLNVMIARAFSAGDGYERLVRALAVTEHLLSLHGIALPGPPALERRKFPRDVFEVLWHACGVLHDILTTSGLTALDLRRGYVGEEPSDVHDLASLIVSELEYTASFVPASAGPLVTIATPAPTLPAHNYRRAKQLRSAFDLLAAAVEKKPDWLGSTKA